MRLEQAYAALRFDPTVPPWLLAALAVVCLLVLLPAALKRARGTVWRALAFAVLLLGGLVIPAVLTLVRLRQRP